MYRCPYSRLLPSVTEKSNLKFMKSISNTNDSLTIFTDESSRGSSESSMNTELFKSVFRSWLKIRMFPFLLLSKSHSPANCEDL